LDPTTTVDGSHQSYRLSEPSRLLPADPTRNPSSFWGDAWRGLSTHGLDPGHAGRGPTTSGLILRRLGAGGSKSGPLKSERPHSFRCHGRPSVNTLRSELTPPFFSSSPPSGSSPRLGEVRPQRSSPGRMAVPPGSFTQALRVGSGRGPILRTALRGATSERVKHATGFTFPGRCDHQDL